MSKKQGFLQGVMFALLCSLVPLQGAEKQQEKKDTAQETESTWNVSLISEAFGHMIGKNLDSIGLQIDIAKVIQGLKDSSEGKTSPMTEMEFVQALSEAQAKAFQKKSDENLAKASEFLQGNKTKANIISLEEDKLQYRIDKPGIGQEIQELTAMPKIKFTGSFLDGKVFGASQDAEIIPLDEAIPGLAKGMIGMKEGEIRTIYIHPELGFGKHGSLPPNSLLTFEVELIKANAADELMQNLAISEEDGQDTHEKEHQDKQVR